MVRTMETRALAAASFLAAVSQAGCASMFLNGGHFADGSEKQRVVAKYKVDGCVNTADGSPIQGTTHAEYWLLKEPSGGVALAEMDRVGEGTVITNTWAEGDGDHFFTWVLSSGWEYVIPRDPGKSGTRIVYTGVSKGKQGSATKPTSAPSATCTMSRLDAPPAPAFVPPAPVPPPAPAFVPPAPVPPPATEAPAPAPAPVAPAPAPAHTKPSKNAACFPACRYGFTCVKGACVSSCNPPCAANESCTPDGECVAKGGTTAVPAPVPTPAPAPAPTPAPVPTPKPDPKPALAAASTEPTAAEPGSSSATPGVRGQILIAPAVGLNVALGNVREDSPQSEVLASPGVAFSLDLGFGISRTIALGLWSDGAFHGAGETVCDAEKSIPNSNTQCVVAVFGVGPQLLYLAPTSGRLRPWIAGGFGYRWLRVARKDSGGGVDAAYTATLRGMEMLRLQGGVDFKLSNHVWVGPLAALSVGTYTDRAVEGDRLTYDSGANKYGWTTFSESSEISSTGLHQFLFIGGRVLFDISTTGPAAAPASDKK